MTEQGPDGRACAASTTGDLLDCDCGYMTNHMKAQLLTLLEEHTLSSLDRQFRD